MSIEEKKIIQRWKELPYLYKVQVFAFLSAGFCTAVAYPLTTKLIYSSVDTDVLASRLVLSSLIGICLSLLWLNIQEKLYKLFVLFTAIECLCYTLLVLYVIIFQDYNSYLIISTIIGGTIGHIVNGAASKLHQKITDNEQYRTDYGFFIEIVSAIGVLAGSGVVVLFHFSIVSAFVFALLGLIGFEICDVYVYLKVQNKK